MIKCCPEVRNEQRRHLPRIANLQEWHIRAMRERRTFVAGKQRLLACAAVVLIIALRFMPLSSAFLGNLGWLRLSKTVASSMPREAGARKALTLFQRAVGIDASNSRAFLGAGIADVLLGDEAGALASWQEGRIAAEVLIGLGNKARSWDDALAYFKGAASLDEGQPNEGKFLAGRVCQRAFAQPDGLSRPNQLYCRTYFLQNGDNLIVNGQFHEGNTWGWDGQFFFSNPALSTCQVDRTAGKPAPCLSIAGSNDGRHHGLYQTLSLRPGTRIRYSAWFKTQSAGEMEARLLYIGWGQHDKRQGNQREIVSGDMEWTYLERTWRLPEGSKAEINLYPVLLSGKGTIWIDDVKMEVLPEQ